MKKFLIVFVFIIGNLYPATEISQDVVQVADSVKIDKSVELIAGKNLTEIEDLRKANLDAQIKEKGLLNLISDYESKIQKFKTEKIYSEYPELMAEYHHNLFDLYIRKLANFIREKGKSISELKNDLVVEDIYKKFSENVYAAILNYKKLQKKTEYMPLINYINRIYNELFKVREVHKKPVPAPESDVKLKKQIEDATPQVLMGLIDSLMIAAFSTRSAIGKGYDDAQIAKFDQVTKIVNDIVTNAVDRGELPREYKDYISVFVNLKDAIKNGVSNLAEYKEFFPQDPKNPSQSVFVVKDSKLLKDGFLKINQIKVDLQVKGDIAKKLSNKLMRQRISEVVIYPTGWAEQFHVGSSIKNPVMSMEKYFPKNESIIFANLDKKAGGLNLVEIIKQYREKVLKKQSKPDAIVADDLLNKIEGLEYILSQNIEKSSDKKLSGKSKTDYYNQLEKLAQVKNLIGKIHEKYPDILSSLDVQRLYVSKNKWLAGLGTEISAMVQVAGQLQKEVNQLYSA